MVFFHRYFRSLCSFLTSVVSMASENANATPFMSPLRAKRATFSSWVSEASLPPWQGLTIGHRRRPFSKLIIIIIMKMMMMMMKMMKMMMMMMVMMMMIVMMMMMMIMMMIMMMMDDDDDDGDGFT